MAKTTIQLNLPSTDEVNKYLNKWNSLENYVLQENSLDKLFHHTYPNNTNMDDVLIKVCSLNDFYSTNIFSPFSIAKHIVELNIDDRLKNGDLSLVQDIATINIKGRDLFFYSFATKYCSHHFDTKYPIYDYYVEKVLKYFRDKDNFSKFNNNDLKEYKLFYRILTEFQCFYNLDKFNLKEIDKYLWQTGKEFFPRNYK